MRISDWSSDVCSSDLCRPAPPRRRQRRAPDLLQRHQDAEGAELRRQQRRQRQYHRACDRPAPTAADVEFAARTLALARRKATPRAPTARPSLSLRKRSEEHTSELQSLMRISYAVFCLKKKKTKQDIQHIIDIDTTNIIVEIQT